METFLYFLLVNDAQAATRTQHDVGGEESVGMDPLCFVNSKEQRGVHYNMSQGSLQSADVRTARWLAGQGQRGGHIQLLRHHRLWRHRPAPPRCLQG